MRVRGFALSWALLVVVTLAGCGKAPAVFDGELWFETHKHDLVGVTSTAGGVRTRVIGQNVQFAGALSPDGRWIFIEKGRRWDEAPTYLVDLRKTGSVVIGVTRGLMPKWSPGGSRYAFVARTKEEPILLVGGTTGKTELVARGRYARYSPSGGDYMARKIDAPMRVELWLTESSFVMSWPRPGAQAPELSTRDWETQPVLAELENGTWTTKPFDLRSRIEDPRHLIPEAVWSPGAYDILVTSSSSDGRFHHLEFRRIDRGESAPKPEGRPNEDFLVELANGRLVVRDEMRAELVGSHYGVVSNAPQFSLCDILQKGPDTVIPDGLRDEWCLSPDRRVMAVTTVDQTWWGRRRYHVVMVDLDTGRREVFDVRLAIPNSSDGVTLRAWVPVGKS